MLLALVAGIWNDDHAVRLDDAAVVSSDRQGPVQRLDAWLTDRRELSTERTPLLLVTSSGGGIRAAYWTASTLA